MADNVLVGQAVDELYSLDPDGFVDRRRELAAEARRGGDTAAATEITGLRKPTRSAWTMNVLARAEPDAFEPIVDVGDQLREAERALDGQRMRELSSRRRELIADISRRAFTATAERSPSPALRDEVIGTLTAAFADPDLVDLLRSGTLLRAAQWDGFGSAIRPDLALVPPPGRPAVASRTRPTKKASRAKAAPQRPVETVEAARAARAARAERERQERQDRREQIAHVRKRVTAAERELASAESDEQRQRDRLGRLEDQVAETRRALDKARVRVRQAKTQLRKVEAQRDRVDR
ncbi:MAG TPA: hypothetical protein VEK09_11825 [Jatrophihabitantaceae bacterium]|nr:hypothetical protein [Jatrophihabitantaceae bacterium]